VLVVISKTALASAWLWLVPGAGLVSAIAGSFGWLLGRRLGRTSRWMRAGSLDRALVTRYGRWAIVLGAHADPLLTCWLAGMYHMLYRQFAPITLLHPSSSLITGTKRRSVAALAALTLVRSFARVQSEEPARGSHASARPVSRPGPDIAAVHTPSNGPKPMKPRIAFRWGSLKPAPRGSRP
jgi:hypothetical protein